ncbi:MAG: DNA replication and repair protein RecF [Chitinophagaceae bacterium]|nr:DNA replication and repair protein RecF [Chitinophagaceae bacterium]
MFSLRQISLVQFKNYSNRSFSFTERITGLCGDNGAGKTNLIDAIYYLCFTKSYFSKNDAYNISAGGNGFRLQGTFIKEKRDYDVVCILRENGKKEVLLDGEPYGRFSKHIGKFPCVMIAPDDVVLITGGSEERRKYIDSILSQLDEEYLQKLIEYNKVLQQRNSLLRQLAESSNNDTNLLDVLDMQLVLPGQVLYEKRKTFIADMVSLVQHYYHHIAALKEETEMKYESALHKESLAGLLHQSREKDLLLQRTTTGIHKDDLDFSLNGQSFKLIASQGQRKSLLFALRLAEFEVLKKAKGFSPLLLLDDVFEKLDDNRMNNLLQWVCRENDGQVFITDTHCDRLKDALTKMKTAFRIEELQA